MIIRYSLDDCTYATPSLRSVWGGVHVHLNEKNRHISKARKLWKLLSR